MTKIAIGRGQILQSHSTDRLCARVVLQKRALDTLALAPLKDLWLADGSLETP